MKLSWLMSVGIVLAGVAQASPVVLYDSLNTTFTTGSTGVAANGPLAASFWTATDFNMSTVELGLMRDEGATTGSISVYLWANSGSIPFSKNPPLAMLGTLADSSVTTTPMVVTFNLSVDYQLTANTRYWIGLVSSNGSTIRWTYSTSLAGIGSTGEYVADKTGVTRVYYDSYGNLMAPAFRFDVMGPESVPEPGTWSLAAFGIVAVGLARSRARRNR